MIILGEKRITAAAMIKQAIWRGRDLHFDELVRFGDEEGENGEEVFERGSSEDDESNKGSETSSRGTSS